MINCMQAYNFSKVVFQTLKFCFKSLSQSWFFICFSQVFSGPFYFLLIFFLGYDQISKRYFYKVIQTNVDYHRRFWKHSPIFSFLIWSHLGPSCPILEVQTYLFFQFCLIFGLFGSFEAIFGVGVRYKKILGPTYIDKKLLFWKYSFILLL